MPNVHIVGFPLAKAKKIRRRIDLILQKAGKAHDAITTIHPRSAALTKCCDTTHHAPYLLVMHTRFTEAETVATLLRDKLNLDVEYGRLSGFLGKHTPDRPPKRKKP